MRFVIYLKLLAVMAVLLLFVGCARTDALYNYGDYSDRYYGYKKDMGEESSLKFEESIKEAIQNAHNSKSGRVAPGLYANLGYIYLKKGNPVLAISNFEKEKSLYPESAHFMNRMIKKIEVAEGEKK